MKTYPEPEEAEMLEKVATSLRDVLLIRLLFRLGCRVSEALAIKTDDIDRKVAGEEHKEWYEKLWVSDKGKRQGGT